MAEDYGQCNLCKGGRLIKKGDKEVSNTGYTLLKCDKCNHQIARNVN